MSKAILFHSFAAICLLSRFSTTPSVAIASALLALTFVFGAALHCVLLEELSSTLR